MERRWLAIMVALAACGSNKEPATSSGEPQTVTRAAPDGSPPRLYTANELARYESDLMMRLANTTKRECRRPVLRGAPSAGSGAPDLVAFSEPSDALGTCMDSIAKLGNKPRDAVVARTALALAAARACKAPLEEAVRRASSHEDACSPYQVGVRTDRGFTHALSAAPVLGLLAQLQAEQGDVPGALWLLLDGVRVFQDLGRGHVHIVTALVGSAGAGNVVDYMESIVNGARLGDADLDGLADALDALLASEPQYADALQGERESVDLFLGLARFKPTDWAPPGGWDESLRGLKSVLGNTPFSDPHDEGGLMLEMTTSMFPKVDAACRAGDSVATCHLGLAKLAASTRIAADTAKSSPDPLLGVRVNGSTLTDDSRVSIRARLIAILAAETQSAFESYPSRRASSTARIASARLHIQVLRAVARTGRCPTHAELDAPPFNGMRTPRALGDQLVIARTASSIEISPPTWVSTTKPPWSIRCTK